MNRAEAPLLHAAAEPHWPMRNQAWLAERFAWWRQRIEHDAISSASLPLPVDDTTFEPAAVRLGRLFGLSPFETELLVLAAGVEIDAPLRDAVARAQQTPQGRPLRLSFALAFALMPDAHWDALAPLAPLRRWSLLAVDIDDGFQRAALRIDERVLHCLTGTTAFDERLQGIAVLDAAEPADGEFARRIGVAVRALHEPLVLLPNALHDAAHKLAGRALARDVFGELRLKTLWLDGAALGVDAREHAEIARRLDREAALCGAGVATILDAEAHIAPAVVRVAAALRSPLIVLGVLTPLQLADLSHRGSLRFNLSAPRAAQAEALPAALQRAAAQALQQFHVEPALLEQSLASAAAEGDEASAGALWNTLRDAARGGLDALAQRIDSGAMLADVVVPPFAAAQLRDITSQLRHRQLVHDEWGFGTLHGRGLGIAALFAGESGTGKTLAAEAIANEARLDLYRIDLASVVSKYVGETEKNLSKLFDAAERSGAVLLFDEADALFGKRSEVKDSHDRFANIEVAYLLQRIESYRGLAILTTNLKSSLDRAFLRRIRFVVQFPFPDLAARAQIWRKVFPARCPIAGLDFARLARLNLSGGAIRNVAVNAAFIGAARGGAVDLAAVQAAAQAELAKLDRPPGEARLGP